MDSVSLRTTSPVEATNVVSVDGDTAGESPPIFAQAAAVDLVDRGNEPPAPPADLMVVTNHWSIQGVAELRAKRVAVATGIKRQPAVEQEETAA